ncbi:FecR family protein [Rhodopirellula sp. JC740]|uniref:FecR family protein n=1 Tax=Rhodopirellula halodulae TaxID=2894198 RepID=A0ABS8NJ79_9BACT|nr:FecR domain-containing protein [Rhodopirellula sp. JC740]MCC9643604.1 FecR family protein [Rhodopirellula sp. JC740]
MKPQDDDARFRDLRDAFLDGRLKEDEASELESLTMASEKRVREFSEMAGLHGELCLLGIEGRDSLASNESENQTTNASSTGQKVALAVGLAATLLVALGLWKTSPVRTSANNTFAVLETTVECLWQTSTVPLVEGQRLGAARLQLASGFASLRFDNQTQVNLEGPAELHIIDAMHCRLASGTVVVTVRDGMRGFVVDTPNGRLTDQGTSFGVSVKPAGEAMVEVFDGKVDLEVRETGQTQRLTERSSAWLLPQQILPPSDYSVPNDTDFRQMTQIITAQGLGADQWIQRDPNERKGPEDLLLVKKSDELHEFDRQIRLRFDLRGLENLPIQLGSLQLTATPSGLGFASRTPDSTFSVYGRTLDPDADLAPLTATPWIDPPIDSSDWSLMHRFVIPKGVQSGAHVIESPQLVELLRRSQTGIIELLIVRDTQETLGGGLVHAFASSRHETLPGPTLRVWQSLDNNATNQSPNED